MKRQPSLFVRTCITVVCAFVLVFAVLLAGITYNSLKRGTGDLDRGLLEGARNLAQALDEVQGDSEAMAVMRVQRHILLAAPDIKPPQVVLARRTGAVLDATPGLPAQDIMRQSDGISELQRDGRALRVYVAAGSQWRVAVVDDVSHRSRQILQEVAADLALYLLWATPILLLPVWFAVRSALAPLKQLTAAVAARQPGDTTALAPARSYAELQPLVDALNRAFGRAAQSIQRERAFVQDAAHELRTPLAVIGTQAHVLLHSPAEARNEAARRLQAAVTRASHLAQQLLRLARADALALAPRQPVDVMNLARDTLSGFAEQAAAQGSELSLSGPDNAVLDTDLRALQSVLENLVDNALRYGGAGCSVDVTVLLQPQQWQLQVADNGPGIAPQWHEQVFERFWRGKAESAPGAGLGLAIVREAARSLGGDVEVRSGPGSSGCELVVRLPRA
jgi:two-component system, OmpR family, sensor histidine kinase QseC